MVVPRVLFTQKVTHWQLSIGGLRLKASILAHQFYNPPNGCAGVEMKFEPCWNAVMIRIDLLLLRLIYNDARTRNRETQDLWYHQSP
jgi:hypothetical protein